MMKNGSTVVSIIPKGKVNGEVTSVGQLSESHCQESLRRTRSTEQKKAGAWRQAVAMSREVAAGRAQHAEQGTQWLQSQRANETPEDAASSRP
jgi:hypothetical protein